MAGKTSIANPVVVLGLDAGPFTAGLEKAKQAGTAASKKISEAAKGGPKLPTPAAAPRAASGAAAGGGILGGVAGAGGGILSAVKAPMVALAAANQVFELGAKISKVFGAPVRALMDREQMAAKATGIGTIDTATSNTFTAGIARFGEQFNVMLADVAIALDDAFDLKGKLEFARGMISGISEIVKAFFGNIKDALKDPDAFKKQFVNGALVMVDVFEWGANTAKSIFDTVTTALSNMGIQFTSISDLFNGVISNLKALDPTGPGGKPGTIIGDFQDTAAEWMAMFFGDFENGQFGGNLLDQVRLGQQEALAAQNRLGGGGPGAALPAMAGAGGGFNIGAAAQQARNAINAAGFIPPNVGAALIAKQADVIMGKIGGSLGNLGGMIASQIAPAITAGTANLDEAMVKATLQGQQGDIQQRIETAIREQITIQTQQASLLEKIRLAITNKPGLAVLGGV